MSSIFAYICGFKEYKIEDLEETLGALNGTHGEGWINISMEERRLFAALLREKIKELENSSGDIKKVE
jgi:hypothetical protein